ncbi:MAG: 2-hydroxyhepta-2,4-diene-1,7-dioate isomerase, partial [Sphingobacteriales bacterium]
KGLPWELAKAFDNSAAVSQFVPKSGISDLYDLDFQLQINGEQRQNGNTKNLLFSFEKIISFVSQYITLKKGDLIFTGTPAGVGKLNPGDKLEGFLEEEQFLCIDVK